MNLQSEYLILKIHHFHLILKIHHFHSSLLYPDVLIYQMIKILLLKFNTIENLLMHVSKPAENCGFVHIY